MKKYLLSLLFLICSTALMATKTDSLNAVSMVSYEQDWIDRHAIICLKNNSEDIIENVSYRLVYFDVNGNQLDYEDFCSEVDIEPGMARQVKIDAFRHDRNYHYYKNIGDGEKAFKVEYELLSYNNNVVGDGRSTSKGYGKYLTADVFIVILLIIFLGWFIGLYVLVAVMAKSRNRNVVLWVILSLVSTPILAIILLLCVGEDK